MACDDGPCEGWKGVDLSSEYKGKLIETEPSDYFSFVSYSASVSNEKYKGMFLTYSSSVSYFGSAYRSNSLGCSSYN